jgi:hypothetical protein
VLLEDEVYWHGWYARNDGVVEFLGDHTAGKSLRGTTVLAGLLILLMFGLVRAMLQYGVATSAAGPQAPGIFRPAVNIRQFGEAPAGSPVEARSIKDG